MPSHFVLTVTGPDRIGIVDRVTGLVFGRGGNVESSRMARLGGEFAVLMLVAMQDDQVGPLDDDLAALAAEGYKSTTTRAATSDAETHAGWLPYQIEVRGADHEGIIHEVAHYLSAQGITIESADSETLPAPLSGAPLFTMSAEVLVPPDLSARMWETGLEAIGSRLNLEISVSGRRGR